MGHTYTQSHIDHASGISNGSQKGTTNGKTVPVRLDRWYYPPDIANDLQGVDLPAKIKAEAFACAWEYTRCVIPQYTNWARYVAFMRIIVMGIVAEVCKFLS
jgi:hypothetical protein